MCSWATMAVGSYVISVLAVQRWCHHRNCHDKDFWIYKRILTRLSQCFTGHRKWQTSSLTFAMATQSTHRSTFGCWVASCTPWHSTVIRFRIAQQPWQYQMANTSFQMTILWARVKSCVASSTGCWRKIPRIDQRQTPSHSYYAT